MESSSALVIRPIAAGDGESYASFLSQLDDETRFMVFEPGERSRDPEHHRGVITRAEHDPSIAWFVVADGARIVGYIYAAQGVQNRVKHRAYLIIGVLQAYHRRGLANQLFARVFAWADRRAVARLELTVVATNAAAVSLYEKLGFGHEGVRRRSLRIDGAWVDEFSMAKLLP